MTCEEIKISLHDFVDEQLDGFMKRDVEAHIRSCDACFNEYKKIRIFFDILKDLPYLIEPPEDLVDTFSSQLLSRSLKEETPEPQQRPEDYKKFKKEQTRQEKQLLNARSALRKSFVSKTMMVSRNISSPPHLAFNKSKLLYIILPIVLLAVVYFIYDYQKYNSPWKVVTLEGTIAINGSVAHSGKISQGQSLFTENFSRSAIHVPKVGTVEANQNSILVVAKAKDGDNRIILQQGSIRVYNTSNMPEFTIELNNYLIRDRGGEFTASNDNQKNAMISVKYGFVEIQKNEETIYLDEGYNCEIRSGNRIGTPYREDASELLKAEIANYDNNNGRDDSIDKIMELATEKDMLTLLAIIPKSLQLKRQLLFQAIANKFPPPENVTRMGIIKADPQMLYLWWQEIEWQL